MLSAAMLFCLLFRISLKEGHAYSAAGDANCNMQQYDSFSVMGSSTFGLQS